MPLSLKQQLIVLLQKDEDGICEAWSARLAENAILAGVKMTDGAASPVRVLVRDVVRVLEGKLPAAKTPSGTPRAGPLDGWQIGLCQGIEAILTGEVVVRGWVRAYLDATDSECLELYEQISRAFHQLIRYYAVRYCKSCRAGLVATAEEEKS